MSFNKIIYDGKTLIDLTDTTAVDSDVAQGKYFYGADGVKTLGTATGGSPEVYTIDPAVVFIDYDGTTLYSYTSTEFASLTELPPNPTHSGLISQGWNWTLAEIQAQLAAIPKQTVYVGQMYITDDGKTRLYCSFKKGRLSPYLGICPNGTVEIDWGDGSNHSTLTGTSLTSVKKVKHTYSVPGDYIIALELISGTAFSFYGTLNGTYLLTKGNNSSTNTDMVYTSALKKVELGASVEIGKYSFYDCMGLTSITMPNHLTIVEQNAFYYCCSLYSITIPKNVTIIRAFVFSFCYAMSSISLPNGITSFWGYCFQSTFNLQRITVPNSLTSVKNAAFINAHTLSSIFIPSGVSSIPANTFKYCYGMGEYHFLSTSPPELDNTAFNSIPSDCIIYVPQGSLSAYQSASYWSNYSSYMQEEP